MNRPPVLPDVAVIRLAREGARISVAQAAELAGMSKARWVQIENGYETRREQVRPARAKPVTIAHMAYAVGLSPERLESEGRNPEAAAILREVIRQQDARLLDTAGATETFTVEKSLGESLMGSARAGAAWPYANEIFRRWRNWTAEYAVEHPSVKPGDIPEPTGDELFPDSPDDAKAWDGTADRLDTDDRVWLIADLRRRGAERNRQASTG